MLKYQEGKRSSRCLQRDEYDYSMDEVIDLLTPIELPSEEENNKQQNKKIWAL